MARALRNLAESYESADEHSTLAAELQDEFFSGDSDCDLIECTVVSGNVASAIKDNMEELKDVAARMIIRPNLMKMRRRSSCCS